MLELGFLDLFNSYREILFQPNKINWNIAAAEISDWAKETIRADASVNDTARSRRPSLRMLADAPLDDDAADLLNFKPYATALAGLIDDPKTSTPLVLSINAPWGAGKTTLARMIERILKRKPSAAGDEPHVTCWFNAWMHDDAPNLASAFAAQVAQSADGMRTRWRRFISPIPFSLRPVPSRQLLVLILTFVDVALAVFCAAEYFFSIPPWVGATVGLLATSSLAALAQQLGSLAPFAQTIAKFVTNPTRAAATASMDEVRKQLGRLIEESTPKNSRFIIFVDDLERCRPPRAVDVLEVVNQLLGDKRIVTVVLGDMLSVATCADIKYRDLARRYILDGKGAGDCSYGRAYIQKIIQLQFDLPVQSVLATQTFMNKLLVFEDTQGRGDSKENAYKERSIDEFRGAIDRIIDKGMDSPAPDFEQLESAAALALPASAGRLLREDLIRERIQLRFGDDSELMREAQDEVMRYVEPLPRHAKRLLNRLRLLLFIAHARGMFGGTPLLSGRHMGKWAVLSERWPELAQILCAHPDLMARLEDKNQYDTAIKESAPFCSNDATLMTLCLNDAGVKLAPVMDRIAHFTGATEPARSTLQQK